MVDAEATPSGPAAASGLQGGTLAPSGHLAGSAPATASDVPGAGTPPPGPGVGAPPAVGEAVVVS
eukprot:7543110-Alexandrium_andersonii.AAC.1